MRIRYAILCGLIVLAIMNFPAANAADAPSASSANPTPSAVPDPLLQILVGKGILNPDEARSLSGSSAQQRTQLVAILCQKVF